MFERYTDRARRVIVLTQDEARDLKHNYIGTEHLLLGLLKEGESTAFKALDSLGYTYDQSRLDVITIIGEGQSRPSGHIPFTPRVKKVLELALREALQLGCNYVGAEHQILGLVREGEGIGAQVLKMHGDLEPIRRAVIELLNGYFKQEAAEKQQRTLQPCVCGHVIGHHAGFAGAVYYPCNWRGCGCPQFIAAPTQAAS